MGAMSSIVAKPKSMLVVEEDKTVGRVLEIAMKHAGFSVDQVTRSSDAVARLEQGGVAGVLIDLGQQDAESSPVLEWLHQHGEQPPWLVLSSIDASEIARIDGSIPSRLLAKPFDPWTLIARVRAMTSEETSEMSGG